MPASRAFIIGDTSYLMKQNDDESNLLIELTGKLSGLHFT